MNFNQRLLLGCLLVVSAVGQQIAIRTRTATILSGATVSDEVYAGEYVPLVLQMPSAFTGTTVTFQGSPGSASGGARTYQAINVGGAAYTETVAASKNIILDGSVFAGFEWIKVVSGSAEGADRAVVVIMRRGQ